MKLSEAEIGEYTVHRVIAPAHLGMATVHFGMDGDKRSRRLRALGIYAGARITLSEIGAGDVRILHVRGMRLALGRQIASRITVIPR